jgi:hypothetical protein
MTEWASEAIWLSALAGVREQIEQAEQPGFILYHRRVLDAAYTERYVAKLHKRFARIEAAGLPEWRERRSP